jgi:hypothetical protein
VCIAGVGVGVGAGVGEGVGEGADEGVGEGVGAGMVVGAKPLETTLASSSGVGAKRRRRLGSHARGCV